jgi:xylan 1,4-beta-xylosidase
MNTIDFEQVKYDTSGDVKPIIANLVYTHPHWHNELEIVFACKGEVSLLIGSEQYRLALGEVAVINSTEIHAVNSIIAPESGSILNKPDNLVFMLQFSGRFMRNLHLDIESVHYRRFIDDPASLKEIKRLLFLVMEEVQSPHAFSAAVINGFSGALIATLTKSCGLPDERESGGIAASRHPGLENEHTFERLKRVLAWINEHYAENPSLGAAAAAAFVSPFYLSHIFTAALGMTYSQYVNSVRIDMARQDLLASTDRITDIMLRHGFSNAKTFNRVFKNALGCSPSEYRKASMATILDPRAQSAAADQSKTEMGSYISFKGEIRMPETLYRNPPFVAEEPASIADREIAVSEIALDGRSPSSLDRYFFKTIAVARASDLLRERVRQQLLQARRELGFEYLRFHGIFNDEMGILHPSGEGRYNFTLIDEIFDFLIGHGMRPFVELSFMPTAIASGDKTIFFYRGNVTPPREWEQWGALIDAFIGHLVRRYTLAEVRLWYFEVWNEPNISDFWSGSFEDYIHLYKISAQCIKAVDPNLCVGGPALCSFQFSEAPSYLDRFLSSCRAEALPLDFVSGHPYPVWVYRKGDAWVEELRGPDQTGKDMQWIRDFVRASSYPDAEIHLDEWNSTSNCHDLLHDTAFMAPFILRNILSCQGLAQSLCYWALSDCFEEEGVPESEFHGGFGLFTKSGLKKPQYHAFTALRRLGDTVLAQGEDYIVTSDPAKGGFQVLAWNYLHYDRPYAKGDKSALDYYNRYAVFERGDRRLFRIRLPNPGGSDWLVEKTTFDRGHGSIFDAWLGNGAIECLTEDQLELLRTQCVPKRELAIREAQEELALETAVEPHGFVLFVARPLDSKDREAREQKMGTMGAK